MTLAEGQVVLDTVEYKPGWKFILTENKLITSRKLEADSTGIIDLSHGDTLTIERPCNFSLAHITDAKCLIDIIHSEIVWLEMHELDEWFKVRGRLWHDPHAPGRNKALEAGLCIGFTPL